MSGKAEAAGAAACDVTASSPLLAITEEAADRRNLLAPSSWTPQLAHPWDVLGSAIELPALNKGCSRASKALLPFQQNKTELCANPS